MCDKSGMKMKIKKSHWWKALPKCPYWQYTGNKGWSLTHELWEWKQDKFLSGVKSERFVNLHVMIWREMLIKKICCVLLVGVFQSEARKNISYLRVCCITILTQNINIGVPKFTFQLHLQGLVLFNLYVPMQTDQIHIRMQTDQIHIRKQTTRVSRVHVQVTSRLIKLGLSSV